MPFRLALASTLTLSMLMGSLTIVMFTAAVVGGAPMSTMLLFMALSVVLGFAIWAFGPWITDRMQSWFYDIESLSLDGFIDRQPEVGQFMREVCRREGMPEPQIRLIKDDNPTAYTFGSLPSNARVAFSTGLFKTLDDEEASSVAAHELGHVRHYDFLVMTVASVLLQLLYESYWWLARRQTGRDRDSKLAAIGLGAYVLWWAGTYIVLWLSRSREYMADRFAALQVGDAAPLQRALVKIAYGLAELKATAERNGTEQDFRLLQSTRALGIADPKAAVSVGNAVKVTAARAELAEEPHGAVSVTTGSRTAFRPDLIEPVFLFDLFNPWATVSELGSTHPLTGKRLEALDVVADELKRPRMFRFDKIAADGARLDKAKLYSDFSFEVFIYFLPAILPFFAVALAFVRPELAAGMMLTAAGLGFVLRGLYSYAFLGEFQPITVYELMCDPYASPLRGRPVELTGVILGKGDSGSKLGEDLMMKDESGALIYLNFASLLPVVGNWIFGLTTAKQTVGQTVRARGWFRRGVTQYVDLNVMETRAGSYGSWTRFWAISGGAVLLAIGLAVLGVQVAMGPGDSPVERDADGVQVW